MICKICKNAKDNRLFVAREMMFGFRDEFEYFECANCACVQIKNVPENLARYYPPNYYSFQKAGRLKTFLKRQHARHSYSGMSLIGWAISTALGKSKDLVSLRRANVPKNAAILDVGCGSGELLLQLHWLGFTNLAGADPFLAKDIVHSNGITVWKKQLAELSQRFDVIMLHHSFEHTTNPGEIFSDAQRILNPGGLLIVRVPVAGSFAWKQYGANWVQLDAPRHIFLPSVQSMRLLATQTGFLPGEVIHESDEFQFWGSEQYVQDIPLHDPRSQAPLWKQALPSWRKKRLRAKAAELNAKGEGDSACFYFRKPD